MSAAGEKMTVDSNYGHANFADDRIENFDLAVPSLLGKQISQQVAKANFRPQVGED